jgi:regulator of sigma E protease
MLSLALSFLGTALLFIIVLVVLIVVHELGHFVAAKLARMRVEEFGIGYPPRALTFARKDGTDYTLNWLPFGGFVRIYGEDDSEGGAPAPDSFVAKPRIVQALVLVAGIFMNVVLAWVLFSVALTLGVPRTLETSEIDRAPDARLVISRVLEFSPAGEAGFVAGDTIVRAEAGNALFEGKSAEAFTAFIASAEAGEPIAVTYDRDGKTYMVSAAPVTGLVPDEPERSALGIGVATIGTVSVPWWEAPLEGAKVTYDAVIQVALGLAHFFGSIFTFSANLADVAGPLGIADAVGSASATGLTSLLSLTAIISINLALVNLLPVPALDGGRLLFVLIESVIRRPIPQGVAEKVNTVGFGLLILLMLAITASDVLKLVG